MLTMKMISIILLTICLNSCKAKDISLPKISNHERCSPFIKKVQTELFSGKCRCHEYQVSIEYIGRIGESYDKPLDYCSNKVSFSPITWSDEYLYFFDEIFFMKENLKTKPRLKK